jgi:glycerol uptake facilitator-like aquaporin
MDSYSRQDTAVLITFGLSMLILAGWWSVKKFKQSWLEQLYIGQLITVYAALLFALGGL